MRFEISMADGEVKNGKVMPSVNHANEIIAAIADRRIKELYGNLPHDVIRKRMRQEYQLLCKTYTSDIILLYCELISKACIKPGIFNFRGYVGNSLFAYLCGISETNPLPPHYRCTECRCVAFPEMDFGYAAGIELEPRRCPKCGKEMVRDGYNMPCEPFFGIKWTRQGYLDMNVPETRLEEIRETLDRLTDVGETVRAGTVSGIHPTMTLLIPEECGEASDWFDLNISEEGEEYVASDEFKADTKMVGVNFIPNYCLDIIAQCEKDTGVPIQEISLCDEKVLGHMVEFSDKSFWYEIFPQEMDNKAERATDILSVCQPKSFMDIARVLGLVYSIGVYNNKVEVELSLGGNLCALVSCFEDFCEKLSGYGVNRGDALRITDRVRMGRISDVEDEMMILGVPIDFLDMYREIRYLFPRSHLVEYTRMYWRMAFYRLNYPDLYEKALDDHLPSEL